MKINNDVNNLVHYKEIPAYDANSVSLIKDNEIKIKDIRKNLSEYEKNPNFYRNKKIISTAVAVVGVAAVALLTYFFWVPLISTAISFAAKVIRGGDYGLIFGPTFGAFFLSLPAIAAAVVAKVSDSLYKSFDRDMKNLKILEDKNKDLKEEIQSKINRCKEHIQNATEATDTQFHSGAWDAMKAIASPASLSYFDYYNTKEKQQGLWIAKQAEINLFKEANESLKQKLEEAIS